MIITDYHFEPPYLNDGYVADVRLSIDGVIDIIASIYRYRDERSGKVYFDVDWPEAVLIEDEEDRRTIEGEILERYDRWIRGKEGLYDKTR